MNRWSITDILLLCIADVLKEREKSADRRVRVKRETLVRNNKPCGWNIITGCNCGWGKRGQGT